MNAITQTYAECSQLVEQQNFAQQTGTIFVAQNKKEKDE